ncbi:MAG: GreA/GreB family elongation factor [Polyangiaceae bacterium]
MDKRAIVTALKKGLEADIAAMTRIARDAADAATHEENKAEGDKDMRATESSYLARGQAGRVADLEHAHAVLSSMEIRAFGSGDTIGSSAYVELTHGARTLHLFVTTVAGGRKVTVDGVEVQATTTQSPLGAALIGLSEGDEFEIASPQGMRSYEIVRVT